MADIEQSWTIVQKNYNILDKGPASVYCDRRLHLLKFSYPTNKKRSASSNGSTINIYEASSTLSTRSTRSTEVKLTICLERIHYIQRGVSGTTRRSAFNYNEHCYRSQSDPQHRQLEIYYSTDHVRSEYLYRSINFQMTQLDDDIDQWIKALYDVIYEAKSIKERRKRSRWILREYDKLKQSSSGLTFDSINGWLNSHLGIVGEKQTVEKSITQNVEYRRLNEITDYVFDSTYTFFSDRQQEILIKSLCGNSIQQNQIPIAQFAALITHKDLNLVNIEINNIRKFLRSNENKTEITIKKCIEYLWSEENSAFDPASRALCSEKMDRPLNHYWISSSHNTYLARTQLFNPASIHCYIQALLKGCRCIEIDVFDSRTSAEPEITHKNTRIKPIPLRDVLEAIHDYAFVTSEYPVIISIENHCSPEKRSVMARMFIEIFGENLIQSPLSSNEICLPTPNQLKRKIILKGTKINNLSTEITQTNVDIEDQTDIPSIDLQGPVQLYDSAKKTWFQYNYSLTDEDLFLAADHDLCRQPTLNEDISNSDDDELTQIWYHKVMSHEEAKNLLLSNAGYVIGTFLIRKSSNRNCYCVTFLAENSLVKSIIIREENVDDKRVYGLTNKTFNSISDLVSYYQTYDFAEIFDKSRKNSPYRLGKPLPRATWRQELEQQPWFQPYVTREQAQELLSFIGEEMTFLIRESSSRAHQDYTMSIYINDLIRHSPIYRDGSDLMLMSFTFTSLIELVNYFTRHPIFQDLKLQKPAKPYSEYLEERRKSLEAGTDKNPIIFKPLEPTISLKVITLRLYEEKKFPNDQSIEVQLFTFEEKRKNRCDGYLLKFSTKKDWDIFLMKLCPSKTPNNSLQAESSIASFTNGTTPVKQLTSSTLPDQSKTHIAELYRLIVYCQGVKLKEHNINKTQDLLEKVRSFKDIISLNYVKAAGFCEDVRSMILFNQGHFSRIYPDFSIKSWNSYNFEPTLYWSTGCQLVALNFQTPDRPMHINAGRFIENGSCGYVPMPDSIRSFDGKIEDLKRVPMSIKIRVVAVLHLRTNHAKSISKVQIKITIVDRSKSQEQQTNSSKIANKFTSKFTVTTINGPCGLWDFKQSSSKNNDQLLVYNFLQSNESDVDLLYFEVTTDNQEFCGQSAIPLSSLRKGIRSVQLYDKFNERLDLSALLIDISF